MFNSKLIFMAGGALIQWIASTEEGKNFANKTIDTFYKSIKEQVNSVNKKNKKRENEDKEFFNGK